MLPLPNRTDLSTSVIADLKLISYVSGGITVTPLADVDGVEHVFDYWKKDPNGISPYACVDSGNIRYSTDGADSLLTPMTLVIGFWARRYSGNEHNVMLDNLILGLVTFLRKKYNAKFASPSVSDYETIDGIPYKFELHFVKFDV